MKIPPFPISLSLKPHFPPPSPTHTVTFVSAFPSFRFCYLRSIPGHFPTHSRLPLTNVAWLLLLALRDSAARHHQLSFHRRVFFFCLSLRVVLSSKPKWKEGKREALSLRRPERQACGRLSFPMLEPIQVSPAIEKAMQIRGERECGSGCCSAFTVLSTPRLVCKKGNGALSGFQNKAESKSSTSSLPRHFLAK